MYKFLLMLLTLLILAIPTLGQDEADICFDNGGFLDTETGQCNVRIALDINAQYPIEYADTPFVMEQLETVFDAEIESFMTMFVEDGIFPTYSGWSLDLSYSEVRHSDTIFSVKVDEYMYMGGAHGISFQYAFTFDTGAETVLTLDDIFIDVDAGLIAVAPLAVEQINDTLADFADADWIADGTAPDNPDNYTSWALTPDSIQFYFGAYQVAAYAAGPQTVTIPFADITDVLEPAFVPES